MRKIVKSKNSLDWVLVASVLVLCLIGLLMVASASWPEAVTSDEGPYYYAIRHLVYLVLGLVLAALATAFPLSWIRRLALPMWLISLFLCLLLWTPLGEGAKGSTRWLRLPLLGFTFMPSDLLKFSSIILFASLLDHLRGRGAKRGFLVLMGVLGASVLIVIVRDFSSAMVIGVSLGAMFLVAGMNILELGASLGLGAVAIVFMINKYAYRLERMQSFRDPFDDIADTDWQLANSLFAFAMGGIRGVGYFQSRQRFTYVPEAYNDFIFAILGEELGLVGTSLVVILFAIFTWRGIRISIGHRDTFKKLLALGLTLAISIQAFFNMGVTLGLLPVTGITLPFISYGGTSLVVNLVSAGILLNLSKSEV